MFGGFDGKNEENSKVLLSGFLSFFCFCLLLGQSVLCNIGSDANCRCCGTIGQALWIVRKSSRDPDDFVLSCCSAEDHPGLKPDVKHIIIRVTSGDAFFPTSYTLQGTAKNQPSFGSLDQLLEHYKNPRAGPPAPIGTFVPATSVKQTGSRRLVPASAPPSVQTTTTPLREASHPVFVRCVQPAATALVCSYVSPLFLCVSALPLVTLLCPT